MFSSLMHIFATSVNILYVSFVFFILILATVIFTAIYFTARRTHSEIVPVRYASKGEKITCENGHTICEMMNDVYRGEVQNCAVNLGNWQQTVPVRGQNPLPVCEKCGADFVTGNAGGIFHFKNGWRYNDKLYATLADLKNRHSQ